MKKKTENRVIRMSWAEVEAVNKSLGVSLKGKFAIKIDTDIYYGALTAKDCHRALKPQVTTITRKNEWID